MHQHEDYVDTTPLVFMKFKLPNPAFLILQSEFGSRWEIFLKKVSKTR